MPHLSISRMIALLLNVSPSLTKRIAFAVSLADVVPRALVVRSVVDARGWTAAHHAAAHGDD